MSRANISNPSYKWFPIILSWGMVGSRFHVISRNGRFMFTIFTNFYNKFTSSQTKYFNCWFLIIHFTSTFFFILIIFFIHIFPARPQLRIFKKITIEQVITYVGSITLLYEYILTFYPFFYTNVYDQDFQDIQSSYNF